MKVLYSAHQRAFVFYDLNGLSEAGAVQRALSNIVMSDDIMHLDEIRMEVLDRTTIYHKQTEPDKIRDTSHMNATVKLTFGLEQTAMAFKLTYIEGEEFIPWRHYR